MSPLTEPLWFYVKDRQKVGPIGWSDLRRLASAGTLRPLDMVLRVGETKWLPAAEVAGLLAASANDEATVQVSPHPQTGAVEAVTAITPNAASLPPLSAPVPGYEILEELGRGGMGVVYRARHATLKRVVALKMMLPGTLAGAAELARFRSEAEAVARLRHPNIVQIYEIGEQNGLPYFSLEYVEGGNLAQQLEHGPLPPPQAAQLLETIARAVAHAHQHQIVHRDLKPANILLQIETSGQWPAVSTERSSLAAKQRPLTTIPKIADFGLAKHLDNQTQQQTKTGAVLGTPSYMAPEQALGRQREVGPSADIYALGAVFFEMLTGRPPFRGETSLETMLQTASQEAPRPSRLRPGIPRDLEVICLKCLEKDAAQRYASAEALADDLRRFLADEPIVARPIGRVRRSLRWVARRPAIAALSCLVFAFALLAGAGLTWKVREGVDRQHVQEENERAAQEARDRQAQETRDRAAQDLKNIERHSYFTQIAQAAREVQDRNFLRADRLLRNCPVDLRDWEWHYLKRMANWGLLRTLKGGGKQLLSVAFDREGRHVAAADEDGTVKVWDSGTGQLVRTLRDLGGPARVVAFSPDGKTLAAAAGRQVFLWDAAGGQLLRTFREHAVPLHALAFTPDSRLLASGGGEFTKGELKVWEPATGKVIHNLSTGQVQSVAISFDGQLLAALALSDQRIRLWDLHTGKENAAHRLSGSGRAVAFDPQRRRLAWVGASSAGVWDVGGDRDAFSFEAARESGLGVVFSPDGRFLATHGGMLGKGAVKVWNAATGELALDFPVQEAGTMTALAYSPDGRRLAAAGTDGRLTIWDATVRPPDATFALLPHKEKAIAPNQTWQLAISPDSQQLALAESDPAVAVSIWQIGTGRRVAAPREGRTSITSGSFNADGQRFAAVTGNGARTIQVWDAVSGNKVRTWVDHPDSGGELAFTPDGLRLASARPSEPGIKLIDPLTGRVERVLGEKGVFQPSTLQFSPDGRRCSAITQGKKELMLWDTANGQELLRSSEAATLAQFSANGRCLARIGADGAVQLWDAATGRPGATVRPQTKGHVTVRVSPDGARLAFLTLDKAVQVQDAADGRLLARIEADVGHIDRVQFSADGKRLFLANQLEPLVRVWDVDHNHELLALRHDRPITALRLSPDGRRLVGVSPASGAKVWDATPLPPGTEATANGP